MSRLGPWLEPREAVDVDECAECGREVSGEPEDWGYTADGGHLCPECLDQDARWRKHAQVMDLFDRAIAAEER